jgi:choline dehydrogenase-like flavoprotein
VARFDLFVIGGGSGGVACARRAAGYDAKVGIAEAGRLGGTCVNRGCIPKKLMHYGADFGEELRCAPAYGWRIDNVRLDWHALIDARNTEVARLNGVYETMLRDSGVAIFHSRARSWSVHVIDRQQPSDSSSDRVRTNTPCCVASPQTSSPRRQASRKSGANDRLYVRRADLRVAAWHNEAIHPVFQHGAAPLDVRCHQRQTRSRRLQQELGHALVVIGRQHRYRCTA